jgi:hypothetical protein
MAKITGYGFWIDIKSLKGVDKRNWLICLISSGMSGAIAGWFSVSLSTDGIEAFGSMEEQNYIWFAVTEIILIYIAVYTYIQGIKESRSVIPKV